MRGGVRERKKGRKDEWKGRKDEWKVLDFYQESTLRFF